MLLRRCAIINGMGRGVWASGSFVLRGVPPAERRFSSAPDSGQTPRLRGLTLLRRGVLGVGPLLLAVGSKVGWLVQGLKLAKFSTIASALLSTVVYSAFWGLPFASGAVAQILLHEGGHAYALWRRGVPFSPAVFIPFVGAVISVKKPLAPVDDAYVALAGPVAGTAAALVLSAVGVATDSQLAVQLAAFGFMVNLFNMMPIGSLDGGRVLGTLSRWYLVAGLGIGGTAVATGLVENPLLYLILALATLQTAGRFFGGHDELLVRALVPTQRRAILAAYLAVLLVLTAAAAFNHRFEKSIQQLRREHPEAAPPSEWVKKLERLTADVLDTYVARALYRASDAVLKPLGALFGFAVPARDALVAHTPIEATDPLLRRRFAQLARVCPDAVLLSVDDDALLRGPHASLRQQLPAGIRSVVVAPMSCKSHYDTWLRKMQ